VWLGVKLLRGGVSECRNKSLQLMFQLMGGGDKAGSGMDKIRAGWLAQHWRSPRLEESLQPDRVKLALPMVSLIPDEVDRALRQRFGDRFAKLDTTAVQAVVTAQVESSVTNARMQEITGEHSKDITGVLQTLVRDGLLTQQNQRRWASYRVVVDSPQLGGDSRHLAGDSRQSSPQLPPNSPQFGGDSPQLDRLAGLSAEVLALLPMAEPARKNKKLLVPQLKIVVRQLCAGRWLSTSELAALVDRDADKLQTRFLTAMVKEGVLELRYPDVRNRPDQAYRTVEPD
jgi:ATP-dependent DNA helicase RecG